MLRRIEYRYGGQFAPSPEYEDVEPHTQVPRIGDVISRLGTAWTVENVTEIIEHTESHEALKKYLLDLARVE